MAADERAARGARAAIVLQRFILVAVLVAVWWLFSLATPPYVLPSPLRVWERIVQLSM